MDDLGEFDTQPDDPTNSSNLMLDSSKENLDQTPPSEPDSQTQSQPFETPQNKPPANMAKANRRISFRSPIEDRQDSPR